MYDESPVYPLTSLYLYLSDQCNLSCNHCWISPKFSRNRTDGIPLEDLKETKKSIWNAIDSKTPNKLFYILVTVLVIVLGGIFGTQIHMIKTMAVLENEVSHIDQVQRSETVILEAIERISR